jgi:hypothetical protein
MGHPVQEVPVSQDKQDTLFERAVKGWTDLSRRSISDAGRLAASLGEAGSRLMLDGGRTLGAWASQVSDAAGKARELVAREAETGKNRGQVVSDIATQIGSAYGTALRGYGRAVRSSVEHFARRYGGRDAGSKAAGSEPAEPGIGTSPRSRDTRPE